MSSDNSFLTPINKDIAVFTSEDYELLYPVFVEKSPVHFSIDLSEAITEFTTSVSPFLDVATESVIDLACFYYGDIDPRFSVIDELLGDCSVINKILAKLTILHYDVAAAEELLEAQVEMLKASALELMQAVHTVFDNMDVTAIESFGSSYKLKYIHNGTVCVFIRADPQLIKLELGNINTESVGDF